MHGCRAQRWACVGGLNNTPSSCVWLKPIVPYDAGWCQMCDDGVLAVGAESTHFVHPVHNDLMAPSSHLCFHVASFAALFELIVSVWLCDPQLWLQG